MTVDLGLPDVFRVPVLRPYAAGNICAVQSPFSSTGQFVGQFARQIGPPDDKVPAEAGPTRAPVMAADAKITAAEIPGTAGGVPLLPVSSENVWCA